MFKKFKAWLEKLWIWLRTPSGFCTFLALCGITLVGCRLGFSKRTGTGRLSVNGISGSGSGSSGGSGAGFNPASIAGAYQSAFDSINRIQREQAAGIADAVDRIGSAVEEVNSCDRQLEERFDRLKDEVGSL
ncbi:MAG: hypothetical protein SO157_04300 [Bullifex sp.]|nr:hypothetical protein [Bullifex sp.]